jgi:hypothetical protein
MQGAALGKTQEMRIRRKKSIDAESEGPDLKKVMARSMSVPKAVGKLGLQGGEGSQSSCSTWDEATPVHKKAKQPAWKMNVSADSSKLLGICKKEPRHAGGFYMNQMGMKMALAVHPSKPSFSPTTPVSASGQSFSQVLPDLEAQFLSSERSVPKGDHQSRLDLYSRHFSSAIQGSGTAEGLLNRLKAGYEELVEEVLGKKEKEEKRHRVEVDEWREKFRKEVEDKKVLMGKVERLTRENLELGEQCEQLEGQCSKYESQVRKPSVLSPAGYPPSPEAYSTLLAELKDYKTRTETLAKEAAALRAKEKKLTALVQAVKRRESMAKELEARQIELDEEEEKSGRLEVGEGVALKRPTAVPRLSLLTVKPDNFSSGSGASSGSQSSSHPQSQPLSSHSSPEVSASTEEK